MNNSKRLKNIDRIVFGIMCTLALFSRNNQMALWGLSVLIGYFISSLCHTPEYFE